SRVRPNQPWGWHIRYDRRRFLSCDIEVNRVGLLIAHLNLAGENGSPKAIDGLSQARRLQARGTFWHGLNLPLKRQEESMNLNTIAAPAAAIAFVKAALVSGVLTGFAPGVVLGQEIPKKGTTPYATHFIFRPLQSIDIPGLGTATTLEAVGTTQNLKGE